MEEKGPETVPPSLNMARHDDFYVACMDGNLRLVQHLFKTCHVNPETPNTVRVHAFGVG